MSQEMTKKPNKKTAQLWRRRNPYVLAARMRTAGPFRSSGKTRRDTESHSRRMNREWLSEELQQEDLQNE
jgi:hypothetical protein